MKWLFVLLLLGNLLFFAYTQLESPPAQVDWRSREVNAAQLRQVAFGASEPAAEDRAQTRCARGGRNTRPCAG